jgi:hypothetical protein
MREEEKRDPFLEVLEVRPTKRWREVGDRDTDTAQFSRLIKQKNKLGKNNVRVDYIKEETR